MNVIFIHGLESSGQAFKANLLRKKFPNIIAPTFFPYTPNLPLQSILNKRMAQLIEELKARNDWIIIGSSFGGLMATLFSSKNQDQVKLLILLAPFLTSPNFNELIERPIKVPTVAIHGIRDSVVSAQKAKEQAERIFLSLNYLLVDDDHSLHQTVVNFDWNKLLTINPSDITKINTTIIKQ